MKDKRTPPCKLCAFCPPIMVGVKSSKAHGRVCHWYNLRLTEYNEEEIRQKCIKDGDHFRWRTKGVTVKDQFDIVHLSNTWSRNTLIQKATVFISIVSLVVAITALFTK